MATPLYTPRINNNDDTVRLSAVLALPGTAVRKGDPVADVETDKATFTVEAEADGYVLAVVGEEGDTLEVGSILMWLGATADEPVPSGRPVALETATAEPTLKAAILLGRHGLKASQVEPSGERLSASDVLRHLAAKAPPEPVGSAAPSQPGRTETLTPEERGMLRTVLWHRDEAVPGYVEVPYEVRAWEEYAAAFQERFRMLFSPLLSLMAWRLSRIALGNPKLNATLHGVGRYQYEHVNVGFTVQSGATLYMVVVERAGELGEKEFVDRLNELQRRAMKHTLKPAEMSGNTISFTSMARWNVSRHMPVLPPHTSLIVAHGGRVGEQVVLGATYDHRVLSGADAVLALRALSQPEGHA
jgi:pyruvate/2-oxoglutarate dehydrogenase complex dihydrolipoamide acyltransferase (E2) component